jgi:hypothetical protein
MWGTRGTPSDIEATKILEKADDSTLKLVNIDEHKKKGVAPAICLKVVQSSIFTTIVMIVVLANTIFTATIKHTHNEEIDRRNRDIYHKIEVEEVLNRFLIENFCFRVYLLYFLIWKQFLKSFHLVLKIIFEDQYLNLNLCLLLELLFIAYHHFIVMDYLPIFKFFVSLVYLNQVLYSKIFSTK